MGQAMGEPTHYQICIRESLDDRWSEWLDGAALSTEGQATVLTCPVADQAALQGLLRKLYSLGLTLISVNPVEEGASTI